MYSLKSQGKWNLQIVNEITYKKYIIWKKKKTLIQLFVATPSMIPTPLATKQKSTLKHPHGS